MTRWADAIRRLRLQSDLNVETLATFAGLYPERLRDLEGGAQASPVELDAIACVFGLELRELLDPELPPSPVALLFRAREDLGAGLKLWKQRNAARLGLFLRCVKRLHSLEGGDASALTHLKLLPSQAAADATERGAALALQAREALKLDTAKPIPSMRALMDQLGVAVFALRDPSQTQLPGLDAACTLLPRPAILLNLDGRRSPWWRVRMTLAHELAHLLFDHRGPGGLHTPFLLSPNSGKRATFGAPLRQIERRANAFAANLLAPPDGVRAVLASLDDPTSEEAIRRLIHTFGVGREVAIRRIGDVLYPRQPHVQRDMESRSDAQHDSMPPWPADTFPLERCGLPGGPLRAAVLRKRREEALSPVKARALLDLQLTDELPPGEGLSEEQRRPVHTREDVVRRAVIQLLGERGFGLGWGPGQITETADGWEVQLLVSSYTAPPEVAGCLRLNQRLELVTPLERPELMSGGA